MKHHIHRRTILSAAGAAWLTPLAERLARGEDKKQTTSKAKSLIVLWMGGGPSQLETFDPHPDTEIAAGSTARKTSAKGIWLGSGLEQLADQMHDVALLRSVFSQEGDHTRAVYNVKTGFRPAPTVVHPSIGAIVCHQLQDNVEIPRHISILPTQSPAKGGYLGYQFDAFKVEDPIRPVPDVRRRVSRPRFGKRLDDLLEVIEPEFRRGRLRSLARKTSHLKSIAQARRMMDSDQLKAFDIRNAPRSLQSRYGRNPFGRACLAAVQLIQTGVRCVEITLNGWDSHINNHKIHERQMKTLDPAFATLLSDLRERKLLDQTIVLCGGEFGRGPKMNPLGGRDHWPHGFSLAIAGGGVRAGHAIGETAANPILDKKKPLRDVKNPIPVADIHATLLAALGVDGTEKLMTPLGRPMAISDGKIIPGLFG